MTHATRDGTPIPRDLDVPRAGPPPLKAWFWGRPEPRATLVIVHGLGEHGGAYARAVEAIAPPLDLDVLAVDLRGHGRSPGRRAVVGDFGDFQSDVAAAFDWLDANAGGRPRFLLGHSMGGTIALRFARERPDRLDGLVASNPALKIKIRPREYKIWIGKFLRAVAPGVTLSGALPVEDLTGDPLAQVALASDRLNHARVGAPLYFGMWEAGTAVLERAGSFDVPLLLFIGGADRIVDPDAGRALFRSYGSADKTLVDLPESRHHPFLDRDRGRVYRELVEWLGARSTRRERSVP